MSPNKDKTGNERQQRRREREKTWLKVHGFQSWEALHTALMKGETSLTPLALDGGNSAASEQLSTPEVLSTLQGESTPAHRK